MTKLTRQSKLGQLPALPTAYRPRSIKRTRRTKQEMRTIREALVDILRALHPMTDRQLFYQAVNDKIIEKDERDYHGIIIRLLGELRRSGDVPFEWIADYTRWMRKPRTHHGLRSMLEHTKQTYRRALWDIQEHYVEIWLEKDALAGVLYDVTEQWDVPLMVTRGYASLSFLHSAADTIQAQQKPAYLYYCGDWDPSGRDIPRAVEAGLREFAPYAEIHFERIAVTQKQIKSLHLPTRPTKTTDSRAKSFTGESVEVDAIPPDRLRSLVTECIAQHLDEDEVKRLEEIEDNERATLDRILRRLGKVS